MLGRLTQQETEDSLQLTAARIDAFSLTTHKELDTTNNHMCLEMDPSQDEAQITPQVLRQNLD